MDSIEIIETGSERLVTLDLKSKLLQSNTIFITDEINPDTVSTYQAELFYLTSKISSPKTNPIKIYINSPGGDIYSLLGLYDTIQFFINSGYIIRTINIGVAASAAAIILMAGSPGNRCSTKNSTVLLHQPSSGTFGTVTDMSIDLKECERLKKLLNNIIVNHSSKNLVSMIERDTWLSAEDALKYNIIDQII